MAAQVEVFTCAVCLFDVPVTDSVKMPCCDRDESTMKFCRRCIEIICASGVGRCPTCRGYIAIQDGTVSVTTFRARCAMCCNIKEIVDDNLCDACLLGSRYPFTYECQRCHRKQVIPHPMWRYQTSPDEFGSATWACHQLCGDYTHWRIVSEDVAKVPPAECPETWDQHKQWLSRVRKQRQQEMN